MRNVKKLLKVVVMSGALLAMGASACGGDGPTPADSAGLSARSGADGGVADAGVPAVDAGVASDGGACTGGCWLSWV
jgi:hypothetical protein